MAAFSRATYLMEMSTPHRMRHDAPIPVLQWKFKNGISRCRSPTSQSGVVRIAVGEFVSRNWGDHGAIMGRIQEIDRRDRKLDGKSVEGRGSLFGVQTAIT